ncbi:MAG: RNA-binding protein, partial [Waddliaceae bacterium]
QMLANIPSLRAKYPTYADFAGKSLHDIFPSQVETATVRIATEFASVLLMNQGGTTFSPTRLPAEAQFSPIYAILIDDFNKDGFQDILLGGNFFGVLPDQGRYDASYGSLLLGDDTGAFEPASLQDSGFVISGEVRQIKSLQTASGETHIFAARNNDTVAIFKLK